MAKFGDSHCQRFPGAVLRKQALLGPVWLMPRSGTAPLPLRVPFHGPPCPWRGMLAMLAHGDPCSPREGGIYVTGWRAPCYHLLQASWEAWCLASPRPHSHPPHFLLMSRRCRVTTKSPGSAAPLGGMYLLEGLLIAQLCLKPPVPMSSGAEGGQGRGGRGLGQFPRSPEHSPAGSRQHERLACRGCWPRHAIWRGYC